MITIQTQLTFEQLLEAARQLSPAELDDFQKQVTQLRASKNRKSLPKQESDLLIKINNFPSPQADAEYQALLTKRKEGTLLEAEHQTLISLTEKYEQQDVRRVKCLARLAKLRGVSLTNLMDTLEIPQPTYG